MRTYDKFLYMVAQVTNTFDTQTSLWKNKPVSPLDAVCSGPLYSICITIKCPQIYGTSAIVVSKRSNAEVVAWENIKFSIVIGIKIAHFQKRPPTCDKRSITFILETTSAVCQS